MNNQTPSDIMPIIEEVEKLIVPQPIPANATPQQQLVMNIIHILNLLITVGILIAYLVGHYQNPVAAQK